MATTTTTHVTSTRSNTAGVVAARPILRVAVLGGGGPSTGLITQLLSARDICFARAVDLPARSSPDWKLSGFDVAVWADNGAGDSACESTGRRSLSDYIEALGELRIGVVVLTNRPEHFANVGVGFVCLPPDVTLDVLYGAIAAVRQCQPAMQAFCREITGMQRLHASLHRHFDAIDRELHLASRLQRDFMPRSIPADGPLTFSTFFRPCTWVSGDIFDIFRLDENHYGFYLADAVGHGVAAGLLTMYIKHAIKPKRIRPDGYDIVRPAEVLAALNDQLASQDLPDSQFITGWYGIINRNTLRLDYAVAGHPPPMLFDGSGFLGELHGEGSLLGLCPDQKFTDESITLKPGQRLVIYSDGLESIFIDHRPPMPGLPALRPGVSELLRGASMDVERRLTEILDTSPGGLSHADDASMVMLDIGLPWVSSETVH